LLNTLYDRKVSHYLQKTNFSRKNNAVKREPNNLTIFVLTNE